MARRVDVEAADNGGGFGWGFFVGGLIGFAAGAYLASGPGRDQVDNLRTRTIELTGSGELQGKAREYAQRARTAVNDPGHPVGKAIRDGVAATRRRRQELEGQPPAGRPAIHPEPSGERATVSENGTPEA